MANTYKYNDPHIQIYEQRIQRALKDPNHNKKRIEFWTKKKNEAIAKAKSGDPGSNLLDYLADRALEAKLRNDQQSYKRYRFERAEMIRMKNEADNFIKNKNYRTNKDKDYDKVKLTRRMAYNNGADPKLIKDLDNRLNYYKEYRKTRYTHDLDKQIGHLKSSYGKLGNKKAIENISKFEDDISDYRKLRSNYLGNKKDQRIIDLIEKDYIDRKLAGNNESKYKKKKLQPIEDSPFKIPRKSGIDKPVNNRKFQEAKDRIKREARLKVRGTEKRYRKLKGHSTVPNNGSKSTGGNGGGSTRGRNLTTGAGGGGSTGGSSKSNSHLGRNLAIGAGAAALTAAGIWAYKRKKRKQKEREEAKRRLENK